jgi:hypothetical protein
MSAVIMKKKAKRPDLDSGNAAMDLSTELRQRQWPKPATGVLIGDYEGSPYVRTGRVFSRALRLHQQVSRPIPAGESAITSLCRGANGMVYGATSGRASHLFYYDPGPTGDGVVDLGVLPGVTDVRRCLVAVPGNRVIAGASAMAAPGKSGPLFVYETGSDNTAEYGAGRGPVKPLTVPVDGECVAALACDAGRNVVYGISSVSGTLWSCNPDSRRVRRIGRVSKDGAFSRCLVIDSRGRVFGTHSLGALFRYDPDSGKLEDLGASIPTVAGREMYNAMDSAVWDPVSGLIYGAGTADGVLFSLDPDSLDVRALGKATAAPRVRAMAAGLDGRIYGISGDLDGMGHLFCYDAGRRELRDLGIMFAVSEVWRRGFEFDAACTGANGEIYFGESERESHLYLYFPPIERRC